LGLIFLVVGAELLVRGASRLALAAGVSALVTGLNHHRLKAMGCAPTEVG
jgi:Ca2+/Na+ antiporter